MPPYRSRTTTHGRNMAGARGLWRATGMKDGDFGKPIIAVANSFTQFVPGHVHLKDMGQLVAREHPLAVDGEGATGGADDDVLRTVLARHLSRPRLLRLRRRLQEPVFGIQPEGVKGASCPGQQCGEAQPAQELRHTGLRMRNR